MSRTIAGWREEFKYWIDGDQARRIVRAISSFVVPDPHADSHAEATYTVRSIYYDSPRFDFYHHKVDGLRRRKKLRVRSYARDGIPERLFLEIKHKRGRKVLKERAPLSPDLCKHALVHKEIPPLQPGDGMTPGTLRAAGRFVWFTRQLCLEPVVLVAYDRTAYVDRWHPQARLTMDRGVQSLLWPTYDALFEEGHLHPCTNGHVILELKFGDCMPQWMRCLIRSEGLMSTSISKYCLSLESWRSGQGVPEASHPSGMDH
ncbi:polyphosphate polymerase domain-containing protein [Candidatus Fermentibacteria bacterium]|nr:polyphosphate polymerase domain-containing protein [Candidatus Fermentibacteria bacterium]